MRPRTQLLASAAAFSLVIAAPSQAVAQIEIVLRDRFIKKYEDRVTIAADLHIDHVKAQVNSPSKDGDLHVAARDPGEIQLPIVAELMNARSHAAVVTAFRDAEDSSIPVAGVWRIWAEHGGSDSQIQGNAVAKATNSNPDHVFEIHPVTRVGTDTVVASLAETPGYAYKDAEQAFMRYENVPSKLSRTKLKDGSRATKIVTGGIGYNYVQFRFRPHAAPAQLADGSAVMASVHGLDGDLLVRKRRMVFVDGSDAENAVEQASASSCLEAVALPRVSLKLVQWRTSPAGVARGALTWNLPYEMIVVAAKQISDDECDTYE